MVGSVLTGLIALSGPLVEVAQAGGRNGGCSPKQGCSTKDTIPPTVSLTNPTAGSTVSGQVAVNGTAADNLSVVRVDLAVDNGPFQTVSGTTSWSHVLDLTTTAVGAHTLVARATDGAGRTGTASVAITVGQAADTTTIRNPAVNDDLLISGRGQIASLGSLSVLLYQEQWSHKPWAYVRDAHTGAATHVALPVTQPAGRDWSYASWGLTSPQDLWVFSGGGPVHARHYRLTGSSLPTSAALIGETSFGDTDSRAQDVTVLASGAVVGVWHQQGQLGPEGQFVAYRSAAGGWSTTQLPYFIPTASSTQAVVQHPVDGSLWVFSNADAWSAIGVAHLTEVTGGLRVDWTDGTFLSAADGAYDPDPEMPDVVAVPDPSTGTVAVAYQSAVRQRFTLDGRAMNGSHVAVARVDTAGAKSFLSLPIYTERSSPLGLVVPPGETWLAYRPVDAADLTCDDLHVAVHRGGAWETPQLLGTLWAPYDQMAYGTGRAEFVARLQDGALHVMR